ncbi:dethiobiotin synthase [Pseudomarimonas salicorniae]|uniref:ATP-dependent dethiobiotin synthetase BioD n=1 Tax=Pseudomarimonas salicorniae TaxID=2933270 RepID=A0ABT0GM16_9GAMM|nr:dethiobiotin synthase [Lysobacter sp. CAU 1642]MCK7595077.1 dethiobiotin synthase [Lysobacter sp. CAU 1642]
MDRPSLYITGTDTGAGKTAVSSALLRGLCAAGWRAMGMKPLASGCEWRDGRWQNEDALALLAAGASGPDYATVNPIALPAATAPEIAAREAGIDVSLAPVLAAHARLAAMAQLVLVEGVGGWMAPLSAELMQADLVRELDLPVVLVVGLRLGCINHALLSERAIRTDGARLLGWIGNSVDPDLDYAGAYEVGLRSRMASPCLGWLRHGEQRLEPAGLLSAMAEPAAGAG